MGHFSHNCKLTGISITGGTPAVLIVMQMRKNLYSNSEEKLQKIGSTYMCSNEGSRLKFMPVWFPIRGRYDDYGGIEDIQEDGNTKVLEEYYGLPIQDICNVITSNRKDDGYDDALKVIKDGRFKDEYGKPVYKERYKELIPLSGMWIHGEVYDKLTASSTDDDYSKLDLGNEGILLALGFTKSDKKSGDSRYTELWEKGKVSVMSDGTWLHVKGSGSGIYRLKDLKNYCESKGEALDITKINQMDATEQLIDLILPVHEPVVEKRGPMSGAEIANKKNRILRMKESMTKEEGKAGLGAMFDKMIEEVDKEAGGGWAIRPHGHMASTILYRFMNSDHYKLHNPLTPLYIEAAKKGTLRDELIKFWRFDHYMFVTGTFYDIVGTGPQDGEDKDVQVVLHVAKEVIDARVADRYEDDDEDEE